MSKETEEMFAKSSRANPRGTVRQPIHDSPHEPIREAQRQGQIVGRNGEVLNRHRVAGVDQFAIPPEIVPVGWSYQWNTVSILNNADLVVGQSMQMYENGWRTVPAERHPGRFVPVGKTGDIVRDGMRLEERPLSMTLEAQAEDVAVARRQKMDRDQSLMGGKAAVRGAMQGGFEMSDRYRGTGGSLKMSIDPALDVPGPSHPVAESGE